mmetsp:Transcript_41573/g.120001  ORF Transcript_41573/g.120001 Transcript_41573/m.120001 type:complete len:318 (+) Transcript_41573:2460-3413(+)
MRCRHWEGPEALRAVARERLRGGGASEGDNAERKGRCLHPGRHPLLRLLLAGLVQDAPGAFLERGGAADGEQADYLHGGEGGAGDGPVGGLAARGRGGRAGAWLPEARGRGGQGAQALRGEKAVRRRARYEQVVCCKDGRVPPVGQVQAVREERRGRSALCGRADARWSRGGVRRGQDRLHPHLQRRIHVDDGACRVHIVGQALDGVLVAAAAALQHFCGRLHSDLAPGGNFGQADRGKRDLLESGFGIGLGRRHGARRRRRVDHRLAGVPQGNDGAAHAGGHAVHSTPRAHEVARQQDVHSAGAGARHRPVGRVHA